MELKDVAKRLDIIKLSVSVNDTDTIKLQAEYLKKLNNLKLNEIISLLESKNYRQALYLIKKFKEENNIEDDEPPVAKEEKEYVLNVDDMLKMSPIAKETINQFRESGYSADDLEAFSKNIAAKRKEEDIEDLKKVEVIELPEEIDDEVEEDLKYATKKEDIQKQEEAKKQQELNKAIEDANKDTPLDEISSQVIKKDTKSKRAQVLSSYKTLRAKFAKKENNTQNNTKITQKEDTKNTEIETLKEKIVEKNIDKKEETKKKVAKNLLIEKLKKKNKIKNRVKQKEEEKLNLNATTENEKIEEKEIKEAPNTTTETKKAQEKTKIVQEDRNEIYPPIPHIEEKFRQAFTLYPPVKESDIWVEEVAKFLKYITHNSYTDLEVNKFMDEYQYHIENGNIMKASQFLLLASCTDAKYPQFMLARELFKGKILKRNIKKSYELMSALANSGYPDAICDLGQFYEYGIGMPENKKTALKLYEKAFELGLQRATKHINRIKESQRGFLGALKRFFK